MSVIHIAPTFHSLKLKNQRFKMGMDGWVGRKGSCDESMETLLPDFTVDLVTSLSPQGGNLRAAHVRDGGVDR